MTRTLLRAGALSCALLATTCLTAPALAQTETTPARQVVDANGVDVASGEFRTGGQTIGIGGLDFGLGWTGPLSHDSFDVKLVATGSVRHVFIAGVTRDYNSAGSGNFTPADDDGSLLTQSGSNYTLTLADGTVYAFTPSAIVSGGFSLPVHIVDTITRPDGHRLTFAYRTATFQQCGLPGGSPTPPCTNNARTRVQSITDNRGHMLKPTYASQAVYDTPDNMADPDFLRMASVQAVDLSTDYCNPTADTCTGLTRTWPELELDETPGGGGSVVETVTDPGGNDTEVTRNGNGQVTGIDRPAQSGDDTAVTYDVNGQVASLTRNGLTWTYSYAFSAGLLTTTATQPGGGTRVTVVDFATRRLLSETDELGRTTSYQYDGSGRRTRVTFPEGNYVQTTYGVRGNVTEVRRVAKSGSSLADIVTSATYPSTCGNILTCNQPATTVDALGNVTDYTYSGTHGGVTRIQLPAVGSGPTRPEINYAYTALYGRRRNSGGTLVNEATPVYLVTQITRCATAATCAGTANETVQTIAYDPDNLLPVSVTTAAGNGSVSATVTTAYDADDRVRTVDGPLSGSADTTRYYYDATGRLHGLIGPDPDGGSALLHRAVRYTYDAEGRVTLVERGTATSQADGAIASINVLESAASAYDTDGRRIRDSLVAGGTTYALTQYSYDAGGRIACAAVRMNPAEFASLPASACTLDTAGSFGPDRITRTTYDNAGQTTLVETGYGVSGVAANEVASTYRNNGQVETVTDAEGNRTTYVYDGHDRLSRTRMPDPSTDNTSSTTDYEELGYDLASNVVSRRLRDGQSIAFGYDDLGRLTVYNIPQSYAWDTDLAFGYDLLGRPTLVSDSNGQAYTLAYDALGRLLSETSNWYGALATSQYDAAGRRTRLTHRDGFWVDYDYNVTGEMTAVRENGATSGPGELAIYGYDDLGRRTSLTRGNGTVTSYGYDAVSRLDELAHDFAGSGDDVTTTLSHDPAGGIASLTRSNDAYAFGHANANVTDTVNGLNQLVTTGAASVTHDARGNTTGIGSDAYVYAADNRLLHAPGTTLAYDPLGRLFGESGEWRLFHYDGGQQILETFLSTDAIERRYVHGAGVDEPLVWYEGSGTSDRRWLHADERGSIVAVSDGSGAVTAVNSYDEYGRPDGGAITGRFGYTGQAWLPMMDMHYYRARIYNPDLSRFMQTDPIGYAAGMNLYGYVLNNPVNFTDPSGLDPADNEIPGATVCGRPSVQFWHACYDPIFAAMLEQYRASSDGFQRAGIAGMDSQLRYIFQINSWRTRIRPLEDPNPDPRRDRCGNPLPPASRRYSIPPGMQETGTDRNNHGVINSFGEGIMNPYYRTARMNAQVNWANVRRDLFSLTGQVALNAFQSNLLGRLGGRSGEATDAGLSTTQSGEDGLTAAFNFSPCAR